MELRHLRYFIAVAEELNFSRAARRLHVSQPPLSRQIKDLENELGVRLFARLKSKVELTQAGRALYASAQRLLEQSEAFVRQARQLAQVEKPELRVGYIANVHAQLVIDSATRFRKAHPEVTLRVFDSTAAEQVKAIAAGKLHLGFVGFREAPVQEGLEVERIGTTHAIMALAEDHPFAQRKSQPLAVFRDEPFVTISEVAFPGARQYVLQFCAAAGFKPRIVHEVVQPADLLNLVAMGDGVAIVPAHMRQIHNPGVVFCDLREPVPRVDSYVAWKAGAASELLLDFVRTAKATYSSSVLPRVPRRP